MKFSPAFFKRRRTSKARSLGRPPQRAKLPSTAFSFCLAFSFVPAMGKRKSAERFLKMLLLSATPLQRKTPRGGVAVRFRAGNGNQQVISLRKITCGGCSATRHGLIPSDTPLQQKTPRGGVAFSVGAGNGNRTRIASLGSWSFAIRLYPQNLCYYTLCRVICQYVITPKSKKIFLQRIFFLWNSQPQPVFSRLTVRAAETPSLNQ